MERQTYTAEQVARIMGQTHQTVRRNLEPYRAFVGAGRTVITIASVYEVLRGEGLELPEALELEDMPEVLRLSQIAELLGVGLPTAEAMVISKGFTLTTVHRTKVLTFRQMVELLGDVPRAWSTLPPLPEKRQPRKSDNLEPELALEVVELRERVEALEQTIFHINQVAEERHRQESYITERLQKLYRLSGLPWAE